MSNFRVTTNGVMRNYRTNLYKSHRRLNDSMIKVETHRQFNTYAEDPARAARAFQTRRSLWRTDDQLDNNQNVFNKFNTAFTALDAIVDGDVSHPGFDGIKESLSIITDTAGAGRKPEGQVLLSQAEAVLKMMNTTYGENFVFAGSDGLNVPFSWGDDGEVLFRGIPVDVPLAEKSLEDFNTYDTPVYEKDGKTQVQGYLADKMTFPAGFTPEKLVVNGKQLYTGDGQELYKLPDQNQLPEGFKLADFQQYPAYAVEVHSEELAAYQAKREQSLEDYAKLQELAGEATYVDIGLGMEENENGEVVSSSAYNSALSGLNFVGFGVDEDGDSLNFISLMKELGEIANNADPDSGAYSSDPIENQRLSERADVLTKKLRAALDRTSEAHVELDAECTYLQANQKQLKATEDTLQTQRANLEDVDPAEAITDMMWAQYCYNAALRVGNDILSQSLLDYMR